MADGTLLSAREGALHRTLSANGVVFGRIGVFAAPEDAQLTHQGGTSFTTDAAPEPVDSRT